MIKQVIKQRKITLFIVAVLIILGIYNYYFIPKQESPDISAPYALITTIYPGAAPEEVQTLVTEKIEAEAVTVNGYKTMTSWSNSSISIILLELDINVDEEKSWSELTDKMNSVQSQLPEGCYDIELQTELDKTAGVIISMSGKNYTYEELTDFASQLKKQLSKIEGIDHFDITGKQEKEVSIKVNIDKLNYLDLSLEDVATIIKSQNVDIPMGYFNDKNGRITVFTKGTYTSIEEIKDTIIMVSEATGSNVRLRDIADVGFVYQDSNYIVKHDGQNAVLITGYFSADQNILITGKQVEENIVAFEKALPDDIIFSQVLYQPDDVANSINNFLSNLIQGVIIVIIVVLLGMGLRNAVIVSTAIPFCIILTFSIMRIFGIKVHQISITALIIALGMLVDNAIVVSDAIQVRLDKNEDKLNACVNGVKEVAVPILTSTLTTVGAFVPIMLLPSIAGEFIVSIPQIVIISLVCSYLVALFVTPPMAFIFFKPTNTKKKTNNKRFKTLFSRMLEISLKRKVIAVLLALFIICGSATSLLLINLEFFPKADNNIVYIDITAERATDIQLTEQLTDEVCDLIDDQPEVITWTATIGGPLPKFYYSMISFIQSVDTAQVLMRVDLAKTERFKTNEDFVDYIQELFNDNVVGGTIKTNLLEQAFPVGAPIVIYVQGDNLELLEAAAADIEAEIQKIPGTLNIRDDLSPKEYQYYIDVDVDKASYFGISKYDVQKEASIALRGINASAYVQEGIEYPIKLKGMIDDITELENFGIKSQLTGNKALIKQLGDVTLQSRTTSIKSSDRNKTVIIYSDIKPGYDAVEIDQIINERIKRLNLHDVDVVFKGERAAINDNFGQLGVSAVFAVLLIFIILLMQFKSFSQPFIILLTVPFSCVGSLLGLFITRQNLSFTALLGMVSLIGIVVNNAIVLLDYINAERDKGKSIDDACRDAVSQRFRPIILSSVTTFMGLIPLTLSGSELFTPLSVSIVSGLLVSTVLTLVFIPLVYSMIESARERVKAKIVSDDMADDNTACG